LTQARTLCRCVAVQPCSRVGSRAAVQLWLLLPAVPNVAGGGRGDRRLVTGRYQNKGKRPWQTSRPTGSRATGAGKRAPRRPFVSIRVDSCH
jgi:hypothetical protein